MTLSSFAKLSGLNIAGTGIAELVTAGGRWGLTKISQKTQYSVGWTTLVRLVSKGIVGGVGYAAARNRGEDSSLFIMGSAGVGALGGDLVDTGFAVLRKKRVNDLSRSRGRTTSAKGDEWTDDENWLI